MDAGELAELFGAAAPMQLASLSSKQILQIFDKIYIDGLHSKKIRGRIRSWLAGKTVSNHVQGVYQFFKDNQGFSVINFIENMRLYFVTSLLFKSSLIYS